MSKTGNQMAKLVIKRILKDQFFKHIRQRFCTDFETRCPKLAIKEILGVNRKSLTCCICCCVASGLSETCSESSSSCCMTSLTFLLPSVCRSISTCVGGSMSSVCARLIWAFRLPSLRNTQLHSSQWKVGVSPSLALLLWTRWKWLYQSDYQWYFSIALQIIDITS